MLLEVATSSFVTHLCMPCLTRLCTKSFNLISSARIDNRLTSNDIVSVDLIFKLLSPSRVSVYRVASRVAVSRILFTDSKYGQRCPKIEMAHQY